MPQARQSQGAQQSALRRAAPRIAALAAVMFAVAADTFAHARDPGGEISGSPFLTSPAPFPSGAVASTAISPPAAALPGGPALPEARGRAGGARPAGPAWLNHLSRKSQGAGPDSWWPMMGGMALALAICGAMGIVARRFSPRAANGAIQVVGRVSLSPKHTVYLLRVGQRVLLLGAGPQGAPALLGELDDFPEAAPSSEEVPQP